MPGSQFCLYICYNLIVIQEQTMCRKNMQNGRAIKKAWLSHKPKNWTKALIFQSLLEFSFLQQDLLKKVPAFWHFTKTLSIKLSYNNTRPKWIEREIASAKNYKHDTRTSTVTNYKNNLPPLFSKKKPILILVALTFIFDKPDHVINSKNCYCCFSRKLSSRKFQ